MLPPFENGLLPPGIHRADWAEVVDRFGDNERRRWLLDGLQAALRDLASAGCRTVYLDGSFVTNKTIPDDYDLIWETEHVKLERLDKTFKDPRPPRLMQRLKYRGDLLPNVREGDSGKLLIDFFQIDKETGRPKGIVALDPGRVP